MSKIRHRDFVNIYRKKYFVVQENHILIFTCIAGPGLLPLIVKKLFVEIIFVHIEISSFSILLQKLLIILKIN